MTTLTKAETIQYHKGILKGFEMALYGINKNNPEVQDWLTAISLMAEDSVKYIRQAEGQDIITGK